VEGRFKNVRGGGREKVEKTHYRELQSPAILGKRRKKRIIQERKAGLLPSGARRERKRWGQKQPRRGEEEKGNASTTDE